MEEMTAFELCGIYNDQQFKLKGGSVVWESISYKPNCDKCYISRVVTKGGKEFLFGLGYQSRYINPETIIKVIKPE